MIVLDWLIGSNILEELPSSPTALKVEAASCLKRLYLSFTSLHGVMSQKTGIFIRASVRTSDLTILFIALFSCARLSFPQKNCHNFILVQVILTITAVSPCPTQYRTAKVSLAYCWNILSSCSRDDIQNVLFNTGLRTLAQMTLCLYSNHWCHPLYNAHSRV